ncbi:MAG: hypothetical protein HYY49_05085 [Ignavibacteriales bacterium]|nr:hypothetical protein [Ignavibacteriales bacterium]
MLSNQAPRATFAIQISVYNRGKVSLQVYDFVLHAKSDDGQKVTYEPVVLWDLRQWLEDGNRPDKVGRAQKGMVPLPLIVSPGQLYDFSYPILFLPIDKTTLIDPATAKKVTLDLYARTDREEEYQPIGRQDFNADDIRSVLTNTFVSIVSTESSSKRQELLETLK